MGRLPLAVAVLAVLAWTGSAAGATGILAVGDFGVGGESEREIGAAMRRYETRHPAELLVTLGDNDYTASPSSFRRNWRQSFGWLEAGGVAPAGSLGNHDVEVQGGRYEFGLLGMPRAFYKRTVGDLDVFLLDSNRVSTRQTAWLRDRLAASTARWKVVAFHHPPFSCGNHDGHTGIRRAWLPLFERYGVDLVLSGHEHSYQRFAPRRGVRYVVHGGGGAPLYSLERCPDEYPRRRVARKTHGFLYLIADEQSLRVTALTRSRSVIDWFTIYP